METQKQQVGFVSFRLDIETRKRFRQLAIEHETSLQAVLTEAVREWMKRRQAARNHENSKSDQ